MGNFDIWLLLAGVGILLFGMNTFEDGLKVLAGKKMKVYLEKYTRGAVRSVATGSFVTSVLQSSSLISLLLLGFVGAGLMALPNAIGVIIGANIGTTLGALYVALLGFGEFSISAFAMPIIAVGGVLMVTAGSSKKRLQFGKLLIGFGLLFIGIGFMKDSVEALSSSIDFAQYADMALWKFGLMGMIVTLIIQSSSATSVLTFTALASGLISFEASIAIVMGANIGTTATSVLASLGGKTGKRQLAMAQVLFNVISGIIGILLFWQYIKVTGMIISINNDPVFANAILNAIFNVSTALMFAPFIMPFTKLVKSLVPEKIEPGLALAIDGISLVGQKDTHLTADLMIETASNDVKHLLKETIVYNTAIWGIVSADLETESFDLSLLQKKGNQFNNDQHRKLYETNQEIANRLFIFLDDVEKLKDVGDTHTGNSTLEQAILSCVTSMKHIKNIRHNIQALSTASGGDIKQLHETLRDSTLLFYRQLTTVVSRNFTTNNISELDDAMNKIKALYADNIGLLASLGKKSEDDELDTPSLINITRELYDSSTKILEAVSLLYLSKEEKKILEKV